MLGMEKGRKRMTEQNLLFRKEVKTLKDDAEQLPPQMSSASIGNWKGQTDMRNYAESLLAGKETALVFSAKKKIPSRRRGT